MVDQKTKDLVTNLTVLALVLIAAGLCYYGYTLETKYNELVLDYNECMNKYDKIPTATPSLDNLNIGGLEYDE